MGTFFAQMLTFKTIPYPRGTRVPWKSPTILRSKQTAPQQGEHGRCSAPTPPAGPAHSSPSFIFFSAESESSRGRLRASLLLGMLRAISAWGVPRSTSRVVIWAWNSKEAGCLRTLNRCSLRFLRTLLTWDLASVGGRLAVGTAAAARDDLTVCGGRRGEAAGPTSHPQPRAMVLQAPLEDVLGTRDLLCGWPLSSTTTRPP